MFVVSANAEHSQHQEVKITAGGPGNITILRLTPVEEHSLRRDLGNAAIAVHVSAHEDRRPEIRR
jgi:hypothetical protein